MALTTTGKDPAMPFNTYELDSHQQVTAKNYCHVYAVEKLPSALLLFKAATTQAQNAAEYLWQQSYDQYFSECIVSTITGKDPAMPFNTYGLHSHQQVTAKNYCHVYAVERMPSALSLFQAAVDRCVNAALENMSFSVMAVGISAIKPEMTLLCERQLNELYSKN